MWSLGDLTLHGAGKRQFYDGRRKNVVRLDTPHKPTSNPGDRGIDHAEYDNGTMTTSPDRYRVTGLFLLPAFTVATPL